MYNLKEIRSNIDLLAKDIFENCNLSRCNQWSNSCGCCTKGDYPTTEEEIKEIKDFLNNNIEIKLKAIENKNNGQYCIFYDKTFKKCLIKSIRPVICRYVSLRIFSHDDVLMGCSPFEICSGTKSTILKFKKEDTLTINDYTYVYKNIWYLDFKKLSFLEEYYKNSFFKLSSAISE